jgi:hypothetical protein
MSDIECEGEQIEQFDLTSTIDNPLNSYHVVHIYNKNDCYHLTHQILIDTALTHNSFCFFYHILSKTTTEFNKMYSSFACIIPRNHLEADLYLNVNSEALGYVIHYIQKAQIDINTIRQKKCKTIDEIIDLSTIFSIPALVSIVRTLHLDSETIDSRIQIIKDLVSAISEDISIDDLLREDSWILEQDAFYYKLAKLFTEIYKSMH